MLQIIKKDEVYVSEHSWLTSRFLFSFAEYYDPENLSFGNIRVFNDDLIAGKSGFPPHSHKEMEIVTIMHEGILTHEDSMGNKRDIKKGCVQRMSAGTGVTHSEMNLGDEDVRLYQLWFYPEKSGVLPSYEEKYFEKKEGATLLVSPNGEEGSISVGSQVYIKSYVVKSGDSLVISVSKYEYALFYVERGVLRVNGQALSEKDQIRASDENLSFFAEEEAHFLYIVTK